MRFDQPKPRLEGCPARLQGLRGAARGWVAERSKARAWKVRIRQKRIVGSNPTPSAIPFFPIFDMYEKYLKTII